MLGLGRFTSKAQRPRVEAHATLPTQACGRSGPAPAFTSGIRVWGFLNPQVRASVRPDTRPDCDYDEPKRAPPVMWWFGYVTPGRPIRCRRALRKVALEQLARGVLRQLVDNVDRFRDLVAARRCLANAMSSRSTSP